VAELVGNLLMRKRAASLDDGQPAINLLDDVEVIEASSIEPPPGRRPRASCTLSFVFTCASSRLGRRTSLLRGNRHTPEPSRGSWGGHVVVGRHGVERASGREPFVWSEEP
jgi:hypothetical protein